MGGSTCFVPGCDTGYKKNRRKCKIEGIKVKTLFKAPREDEVFEIWKKIIPRKDRELTRDSFICELHFLPEDVEKYFITNLPDGTVNKILRAKNCLRKGAVPCIFPGLPNYLTKGIPKRNLAVETKATKTSRKQKSKLEITHEDVKQKMDIDDEEISPINPSLLDSYEDNSNIESSIVLSKLNETDTYTGKNIFENSYFVLKNVQQNKDVELSIVCTEFNFKCLVENLNLIEKPSERWTITSFIEHVICAKWTMEYMTERRVIIEQDLNVKVFLKESQMDVSSGKKISSLNDVSVLLKEVDDLLLCTGIQQVSEKKCLLYLERKRGCRISFCEVCKKVRKMQAQTERRNKGKFPKNYKLHSTILCLKRKNDRLIRKVNKLRMELSFFKKTRTKPRSMTGAVNSLASQLMSVQEISTNISPTL